MGDELLTIQQMADEYQMNRNTVRRRIDEGELPAFKQGRCVYIRRSDITAMCERFTEQYNARLAANRAKWDAEIAAKEAAAKERAERKRLGLPVPTKPISAAEATRRAERAAAKKAHDEEFARFIAECRAREAAWLAEAQARLVALRAEREAQGLTAPPLYGNEDWAALRQAVIRRDGYICQICGRRVDPRKLDIDHIVPRSKGGTDTLDNLRVAHAYCNRARGNREDWTPGWYNSDPAAYED